MVRRESKQIQAFLLTLKNEVPYYRSYLKSSVFRQKKSGYHLSAKKYLLFFLVLLLLLSGFGLPKLLRYQGNNRHEIHVLL